MKLTRILNATKTADFTSDWITIVNIGNRPITFFKVQGTFANAAGTKDGTLAVELTMNETGEEVTSTEDIDAASGNLTFNIDNRHGAAKFRLVYTENNLTSVDFDLYTNGHEL